MITPSVRKNRLKTSPPQRTRFPVSPSAFTIGFVPLLDAAPLVAALEFGHFQNEGLRVCLQRQLGWGSIFNGLAYAQLDLAHAPFPMLLALASLNPVSERSTLTRWVLNRNGNAITLSHRLRLAGVTGAASFAALVRSSQPKPISLGLVSHHSMHRLLLRRWLRQAGLDPDRHVRLVCLPPGQMIGAMEEEHIGGFCAGEPWNSLAEHNGSGWIAATSAEILPNHPEKILAVSRRFDQQHPAEHASLLRALHKASLDLETPAGRKDIIRLLVRKEYLRVPPTVLARGLAFPSEGGRFHLQFSGPDINTLTAGEIQHVLGLWAAEGLAPDQLDWRKVSPSLFLPPVPN